MAKRLTQGLVRNTIWPKPGYHPGQMWAVVDVPESHPLTVGYGPWWRVPKRKVG